MANEVLLKAKVNTLVLSNLNFALHFSANGYGVEDGGAPACRSRYGVQDAGSAWIGGNVDTSKGLVYKQAVYDAAKSPLATKDFRFYTPNYSGLSTAHMYVYDRKEFNEPLPRSFYYKSGSFKLRVTLLAINNSYFYFPTLFKYFTVEVVRLSGSYYGGYTTGIGNFGEWPAIGVIVCGGPVYGRGGQGSVSFRVKLTDIEIAEDQSMPETENVPFMGTNDFYFRVSSDEVVDILAALGYHKGRVLLKAYNSGSLLVRPK